MNRLMIAPLLFGLSFLLPGCGDESVPHTPVSLEGMTNVKAGPAMVGCNSPDEDDIEPYVCNHSVLLEMTITVPDFYLDTYEVTNSQFVDFLNSNGNVCGGYVPCYLPPESEPDERLHLTEVDGEWTVEPGFENHPVVYVTWHAANDYCQWRGKRLPSHLEWEKAARGQQGLLFSYGNEYCAPCAANGILPELFDDGLWRWDNEYLSAECQEFWTRPYEGGTLPVGCMTHDVSPYGIHDLSGSVMEIVEDDFIDYITLDVTKDEFVDMVPLDGTPWMLEPRSDRRMYKGGGWCSYNWSFAARSLYDYLPGNWCIGFRCAVD